MGKRRLAVLTLALAVGAAFALFPKRTSEEIYEPSIRPIEPGNPCPWRNADRDLTDWFSSGAVPLARDLILSGERLALQERLGRAVRPEEMSLRYYVVQAGSEAAAAPLGYVLPRRMKGPHGAIEFVLGLDPESRIQHFAVQAIREPPDVVAGLERFGLEQHFQGRDVNDDLVGALDSSALSDSALRCARELASEVKAALILWSVGGETVRHH